MRRWTWGAVGLVVVGIAIWVTGAMGGGKRGTPVPDARDGTTAAAPDAVSADVPPPALPPAGPTLAGAPAVEKPAGKDPEKPAAAEPSANAIRVTGAVVDENKKPVVGAGVVVRDDATTYASATTGPDGRFDTTCFVPQGTSALIALCVAREGTRVGIVTVVLRPDASWPGWGEPATKGVREVREIRLAESFAVDVVVTAGGAAVSGADVGAFAPESMLSSAVARGVTDAAGKVRFEGLGRIAYVPGGSSLRLTAALAGRGRAAAMVTVPPVDATPVRLDLPAERVLEVLVVDAANDVPVAGAVVRVSESIKAGDVRMSVEYQPLPAVLPTDASGRTRIAGLAAEDSIVLSAEAPGFARPERFRRPGDANVKPGDTEVKIPIKRSRTVAWPVVAGERPVPADGTVVTLKPEPGSGVSYLPPDGKMVGGRLVVEGLNPSYVSALAYAHDGSVARLWADDKSDVAKETSFRAPRSIEATLTYPDGAPVEGWFVSARNQGNNVMGTPVRTDAAGKALLEGFHGQLVEVYASETSTSYGGTTIGSVDLDKGSGKVAGVVERTRNATARVRLSGKSGLPADPTLTVNGMPPLGTPEFDAAAGTVRFAYRPLRAGKSSTVALSARGWLTASGSLPPAREGEEATVDLDLSPAGAFVVRVTGAGGRIRAVVQRWDEAKRDWAGTSYDSQVFGSGDIGLRFDAGGVARVETAPPGRYRAVDPASGAQSNAVDVLPGAAAPEMVLDLAPVALVKGRIVVPDGFLAKEAGVVREGAAKGTSRFSGGPFGSDRDAGVAEDGTFSIRVPGNVPVTLKPVHPLLVPAPDGGTFVVTGAREDVVLRMVRANLATVKFDREPKILYGMPGPRREKVLLYRGPPQGAPAATLTAVIEGQTARFGGFEPGTWTVWMDVAPFAPLVLEGVTLGSGETDLGAVAFSEGSSIRVVVLVKEGQAVPRVNVWAHREGEEPAYYRGTEGQTPEFRLSGLGPGRFRVDAGPTMGGPKRVSETVDVDGSHEATVTLDLR